MKNEKINPAERNQATAHPQYEEQTCWRYDLPQIQEFLGRCVRLGIDLSDTQKKQLIARCEFAILHHSASFERNQRANEKFQRAARSVSEQPDSIYDLHDHRGDLYDNM